MFLWGKKVSTVSPSGSGVSSPSSSPSTCLELPPSGMCAVTVPQGGGWSLAVGWDVGDGGDGQTGAGRRLQGALLVQALVSSPCG